MCLGRARTPRSAAALEQLQASMVQKRKKNWRCCWSSFPVVDIPLVTQREISMAQKIGFILCFGMGG